MFAIWNLSSINQHDVLKVTHSAALSDLPLSEFASRVFIHLELLGNGHHHLCLSAFVDEAFEEVHTQATTCALPFRSVGFLSQSSTAGPVISPELS